MSDYDRDGVPREPGEPQSEPVREPLREPIVERETTIIHTDTDRGRGSGPVIAIVLILALAALLYFLLAGGGLNRAADEVGVNVNVDAPEVKLPDIDINVPENLPDIDIKTEETPTNTSN